MIIILLTPSLYTVCMLFNIKKPQNICTYKNYIKIGFLHTWKQKVSKKSANQTIAKLLVSGQSTERFDCLLRSIVNCLLSQKQ